MAIRFSADNNDGLLSDPYEQMFTSENGNAARIMQTRIGTGDKSDVHPSEEGHILIQQSSEGIPYVPPLPSITTAQLDCR
jgi:hypothetical protein